MTPTHTNKNGVRYSYYVSQPVLRKGSPGSIGRVSAPELERAVVAAIRPHLQAKSTVPMSIPDTDRELIEQYRCFEVLIRAAGSPAVPAILSQLSRRTNALHHRDPAEADRRWRGEELSL